MSTAVAKPQSELRLNPNPRAQQFGTLINGAAFRQALMTALPKHIKLDKFIRVTLAVMSQNQKLLECSPDTVLLSLMRAASLGLEPDGGPLGQGYLVPFWNGKERRLDCQFIPGYRGLVKLARNSGEVEDVSAEVVYEADRFDYAMGLAPKLEHKRNDESADVGKLKYAYAVAHFRSGYKKFIVLNRREIEAIKSSSASRTKDGKIVGPWLEHEAEMWKKSAVRRLSKLLPLSVEVAQQIESDDSPIAAFSTEGLALPKFEMPALENHVEQGPQAQTEEREPGSDEPPEEDPTNLQQYAIARGCPPEKADDVVRVASGEISPTSYIDSKPWEPKDKAEKPKQKTL